MNSFRFRFVILIVVIFILVLIGFFCCENRENRLLKSQIRDLQVQLAESSQKVDTFTIRDSIMVWKERIVEVDKTDYKKLLSDRELIKDLQLKVSQLESENRTLLSTRDTVVLHAINDSVFSYSDKWCTFVLVNRNDERVLDWEVRDSLTTYVAREYKHKFLWWRWGTKGYNVYIVNHNPKCKVEYNKYIKIKK